MSEKGKESLELRARDIQVSRFQSQHQQQDLLNSTFLFILWMVAIATALWQRDLGGRIVWGLTLTVWIAAAVGAAIVSVTTIVATIERGTMLSRLSLALGQSLFCSMIWYLGLGRMGVLLLFLVSLFLLTAYRDWRVLAVATSITWIDLGIRGVFYPATLSQGSHSFWQSSLEHGFWITTFSILLIRSCLKSQSDIYLLAKTEAELEREKSLVETRIRSRTQELADYGKFLRGVIDGIDAGICILDSQGVVLATNSNSLPYANPNNSGDSFVETGVNYLHVCRSAVGDCREGASEVANNIERVLNGTNQCFVSEFPSHLLTKHRWFQVRVSRVANAERSSAIIVHLDITQRMLALADLQEQKRKVDRLALVAQSTSNGVIITDQNRKCVWVNEGCLRILGSTMGEALASDVESLLLGKKGLDAQQAFREELQKGECIRKEITSRNANGSEVIIDTEIQPVRSQGELTGYIVTLNDITQQATMRERLKSIFAAMAEGILVQDHTGRIIDCNPEAESILGVKRKELIQHGPASEWVTVFEDGSVWSSEDHPARVTLRTGIPIRDAIMGIRHRNGTMRWISINTQIIKNGDGSSHSVVSSFTDITTRREQMQRLDLTISGAGLGVWDWNIVTGRVRFNAIFARILGYGLNELQPTRECWESLIHPEDISHANQQLLEHMQGNLPDYRCEYRLKNKHGHWHWVLVSGRVVERDAAGKPIRMAGVHVDIANIKEMESKLRESENRMRLIFDNAMDGVVTLDNDGKIVDWNLQAERIFGPKCIDVLGHHLHEVILPSEKRRSDCGWLEALFEGSESKIGKRVEIQAAKMDGTRLTIELSITPLQLDGAPCFSLFVRDVTQQKRMELQLSQTLRLESIGQLASGVAHEINTPVQFVNDSVFFVREGVDDLFQLIQRMQNLIETIDAPNAKSQVVHEIHEAVEEADLHYLADNIPKALDRSIDGLSRVAEIVRSMKEFAHQGTSEMKATDLNHCIQSTLIVAKNEYKYVADIELELEEIPEVLCQGGEINQVLLNLIINAAHAVGDVVKDTGQKGLIRIESRTQGDMVEIQISDTGSGIPEAIQHRVFEPFFTTKEVGKGSGQGLALAHNVVVQKHGGELRFDTEPGKGTSFLVRLPIHGPGAKVEIIGQ